MSDQKNKNAFLQFSGLGIQLFVVIYLGNYFGSLLDLKYDSKQEWFSKGLTILAVFASIILVILQTSNIQKK